MKNKKSGVLAAIAVAAVAAVAYLAFRTKDGRGGGGGGNGGGGNTTPGLNFGPMADSIFNAMDGYGTNFGTIKTEIGKLKSMDDWNALLQAYGSRTVSSGNWNIFVSDYQGELPGALRDELRDGQISDLNTILGKFGASI